MPGNSKDPRLDLDEDGLDRFIDSIQPWRARRTWLSENPKDSNLSIDSDSDDEVDGDRDEIIYLRQNSCKFPDVTAQLEQLNGNRKLLFTAQYEEILWMRDYDEELYGEGGEHGIMFQRSDDTDSDSDDDDDDDEDGIWVRATGHDVGDNRAILLNKQLRTNIPWSKSWLLERKYGNRNLFEITELFILCVSISRKLW